MNRMTFVAVVGYSLLAAPVAAKTQPDILQPAVTISELSPQRFELVYSGTRFTTRDEIEGHLLLDAARLARAHQAQWFVLLAMPGERQDVHPPRTNPAFGAKYGHWQPHWNYYLPQLGWQPWHPEWGGEFWTKDVDPATVERFEVHAMIDLSPPASEPGSDVRFNAGQVINDLTSPSSVTLHHPAH